MSDEKKLPTKVQNQIANQLHDSGLREGSLILQAVSRLNKEQSQNLMAKAAEEALRLEVKNREQNMDYVLGKKAIEDHIDAFNMLDKGGKTTRHSVTTDIGTGAGNMRIESKAGATCFVASVAYNDPNHPDVMFLRFFRDYVLVKSTYGREFISWYWNHGPKLSRIVYKSKAMCKIARMLISLIVVLLKKVYKGV